MTRFRPTRALRGGILMFIGTLFVLGCGAGQKPTGTVNGKVTYNGGPVKSGSVNLISTTGSADMAELDENGTFKMGPIEAGDYKVYIMPPIPKQLPPGSKAPPPPAKFEIPKKFQDPGSTTLTLTVKSGQNDVTIDVK